MEFRDEQLGTSVRFAGGRGASTTERSSRRPGCCAPDSCGGGGSRILFRKLSEAEDPLPQGGIDKRTIRVPVIQGSADGAQLAWGNQIVNQTLSRTEQITTGFAAIAQAVVGTLEQLPGAGLSEEDQSDAEANEALVEVTRLAPDRGKIRGALSALKGHLVPVATEAN